MPYYPNCFCLSLLKAFNLLLTTALRTYVRFKHGRNMSKMEMSSPLARLEIDHAISGEYGRMYIMNVKNFIVLFLIPLQYQMTFKL